MVSLVAQHIDHLAVGVTDPHRRIGRIHVVHLDTRRMDMGDSCWRARADVPPIHRYRDARHIRRCHISSGRPVIEVYPSATARECIMEARLNLFEIPLAVKSLKHIVTAGKVMGESTVPAATQELVRLRASQINGCGFCTDMHTKDAAHAGETSVRLNLVAAWREATVFTDAERAALELAEQGTRIADAAGGVTDEAWANAAKYYDEEQLASLVAIIAIINAFNRLNVMVQQPAGDYQPGQFG